MILAFVILTLASQLSASSSDLLAKIPEYGKASVRLKNQKVPEIKAKEGAVLENVTVKNIEVKKLIVAKKVKAKKILLHDCIAYLQNVQADLLEGLAVCTIDSAEIATIKLKGHLRAENLNKVHSLSIEGQCYLINSNAHDALVTKADKIELDNTKLDTLTVESDGKKNPTVILKNSRVTRVVFVGVSGKVIKRDHKSSVQTLENGKQELIF